MNGKKSASAQAEKALRIARSLQAHQEKKFAVTGISANIDHDGSVFTLNNVERGLGDSERVGDRLTVDRVMFEAWRVLPGSATGRFSLRIVIILDKQNTVTSVSDVFLATGSGQAPFLAYVKDRRRRFSVLYDSKGNHMDQYNKGDCLSWDRKVQTRTQFNSGTDQILTGAIKLLAISSAGESSNTKPLLIGTFRVNYTDS